MFSFYKNLVKLRRWQKSILLVKGGHYVGDWQRSNILRSDLH